MDTELQEKKSLSEYTDRELLLTLLAHQVQLSRQLQYLEQLVRFGKVDSLGPDFTDSIDQLSRDNEQTLRDYDQYLAHGPNQFDQTQE